LVIGCWQKTETRNPKKGCKLRHAAFFVRL
jgi:hypothetical protein